VVNGAVPAVLLGGEAIALSVARSLGARGVPVFALGHARYDPVQWSRHCTSFAHLGSGEGVQERWLEWLEAGPRGAVVLPCSDDALELVASRRPELVAMGYRPLEADDRVVLAMLDKERTYTLAREAGIGTPQTVTVRDRAALERVARDFPFPCAVKPVHSHHFARHFGVRTKVVRVGTADELVRAYESLWRLGLELMVTEIIPGPEDAYWSYYTYLDEHGEPLFHLTKHKLRQFPPDFGLATYHAVEWDAQCAREGLRFFRAVGLRGIGNVEFKRDARDGRLKLIECNHRFTAGNELVRRAGIDLAVVAYARALGDPVPAIGKRHDGARMWHPVEDARAFVRLRSRGELTTRRWLASLLHRQHFPVLAPSDPKPALFTARLLVLRVLRRRRKRTSAGAFVPAKT
jgi:predicted ATP-grasp superfamily ATP-dependent carboligase